MRLVELFPSAACSALDVSFQKRVCGREIFICLSQQLLCFRSVDLSIKLTAANPSGGNRICLICSNGVNFVIAKWAIWMSGNIVVPLSPDHSPDALNYFVKACQSSMIIGSPNTLPKITPLSRTTPTLVLDDDFGKPTAGDEANLDPYMDMHIPPQNPALILFSATSSGNIRGHLYRHQNLMTHIDQIKDTWNLNEKSSVLHSLQLNKPHGLVNSLLAPMSAGGRIIIMNKFDPLKVTCLPLEL